MMSYCTDCIHYKVCGNEGVDDVAMTYCADKQTDGDLISRKAVNKLRKYNLVGGVHTVSLDDINKLPSAEKTAKWIHRFDDYNDWLECSECGYGAEGEVKFGEETNYCPNCGAKMKGEE